MLYIRYREHFEVSVASYSKNIISFYRSPMKLKLELPTPSSMNLSFIQCIVSIHCSL